MMFSWFLLCVTFSSVEGFGFRNEVGPGITTGNKQWSFIGQDGSWSEPIDSRDGKTYYSEQECHSDSPQEVLSPYEFLARNKILNQVRPWKVPRPKDVHRIPLGKAPTEINTFYYTNRDNDTARDQFMTLQMRSKISPETRVLRWQLEDITDIDSPQVQEELKEYSDDTLAEYLRELPPQDAASAVASYISTMKLLKHIKGNFPQPNDLFVISEDDVQFNPDWEEELLGIMKKLPQDWDVAKFVYWGAKRCQDIVPAKTGYLEEKPWYEARGWKVKKDPEPMLSFSGPVTPPPLSVPHDKKEVGEAWYAGNQAYIIRAGSIPDILAQAKALPVMHVDGVLSSGHQEGWRKFDAFQVPWTWGIHSYALHMPLGHQVAHDEIERHDRPSWGSDL